GIHRHGTYHDHCVALLEQITKPVITTFHTVLPKPEPWMRDTLRRIAERSTVVVVMAETAARLLRDVYGIDRPPVVIPHGMPAIAPHGRHRFKRQLGIEKRTIVSTFGLVDRSEEHTSELQSRFDLVCRLLLEKKNKNNSSLSSHIAPTAKLCFATLSRYSLTRPFALPSLASLLPNHRPTLTRGPPLDTVPATG